MSTPTEVQDADFEEKVLKAEIPALVDFWADWCGPCRMIAPIVEDLAREYEGKIFFAKLNVDQNRATAMKFDIFSIPTLLVFKEGKEINRMVGYMSKEELVKRLESALST